ncbi:MAG TPA: hypothetical protein VMZ69_03485, partial [Saprospiraceae bacterium]|nr:hypothetical protein [Saprospiraceae bacterium]
TVDSLDQTKQYIVMLKEGDRIIDTFVVTGVSKVRLEKRGLLPSKYSIDIIEDLNSNGTWDTGNYEKKRQPERKMIFIPEPLRAGWEQEAKLIWK